MVIGKNESVIIRDYDPRWGAEFNQLRKIYYQELGDFLISVEHVGSTAVPGLAAKPIIDIDLVISSYDSFQLLKARLMALGYFHQCDLGIEDREAFGRKHNRVPITEQKRVWLEHHLYVCPKESQELKRHLAFRDYLCRNDEESVRYGELKKSLAIKYRNHREAYTEGKSNFIQGILDKIL